MIGLLRGNFSARDDEGTCIVDVSGVGYEVFVPLRAIGRLESASQPVSLVIHTHVREDAITLYGFETPEDRLAFRALLGVHKVGPKVAFGIMSSISTHDLAVAVQRNDRASLKGIPGVGAKTLEQIFLELKDKLPIVGGVPTSAAAAVPAKSRAASDPLSAVANALMQLGYKPSEAERAAASIADNAEGKPIEVLIREALVALS